MCSQRIPRFRRLVDRVPRVHDPRHAKVRRVAIAPHTDAVIGTMRTGSADVVEPWIQWRIEILAVRDFQDGGLVRDDGRGGICRPVGKGCGGIGLVSVPFVDVRRWGEERGGPPQAVREIDPERRLGRLGRNFLRRIPLLEQAEQLLPLLFVFGVDVDRVGIRSMPVHGIPRSNDVNFSEGDQGEDGVDEGGNAGQSDGGDGS